MAMDYVEISMRATLAANGGQSKNIVNIFNCRRVSGATTPVKSAIEAAFQTAIGAPILAASSDDYVQDGTAIRYLDDATDPPVTFAEAGAGAISTDRMPGYNAVVVQMHTAIKGKSGRGSKHFAGVVEAHTTGDILTGTGVTLWQAVATAMAAGFTDAQGNSWRLGINSHKPPAQWLVNPVTIVWNDVTSTLLNLSLGTMRRRKVRTVV